MIKNGKFVAKIGENSLDFYADGRWQQVKDAAREHSFFHWDLEFPDIFYDQDGHKKKNPGFDGVVGNPPYIEVKKIDNIIKPYLQEAYQYENTPILKGRFDIFWAFIVIGIRSLVDDGNLGFLTEDSILDAVYGDILRRYMINETIVNEFIYTGKFPTANVHTVIITLTNDKTTDYPITLEDWTNKTSTQFLKSDYLKQEKQIINLDLTINNTDATKYIVSKIEQDTHVLSDIIFLQQGIVVQWGTGIKLEKTKEECIFSTKQKDCVPYLEGKHISRYAFPPRHKWLEHRPDKHHRPRMKEVFTNTKLLVRRIATDSLICLLDYGYYYTDNTLFTGTRWTDLVKYSKKYQKQISRQTKKYNKTLQELTKISSGFSYEYLLAILNSKLMTFYYEQKFKTKSIDVLTQCKIKIASQQKQKEVGNIAIQIQKLFTEFHKKQQIFFNRLLNKSPIENTPKSLYHFHHLNFSEFLGVCNQNSIKLPLTDQDQWEKYFADNKHILISLDIQIQQLNEILDDTIYDLYGLSDDDIRIIKNS